ncbi:MAG TPA: response regulator transcription factor [Acidimicrobiia bacterium]|jgi:DNA-binding NarL/FixJ family response regulator|nr:response regulator transcription factor [Acidimicrobiia bacterium]
MSAPAGDGGIRVFVVDDHPLVRSGVRSELEGRVDVVGTAGDVDEAAAGIAAARPDVVLVDVHMPGGGGAELIRRVLAAADATSGAGPGSAADSGAVNEPATSPPVPRFLALSVSDAADDVISVIRAGARGYLTKTVSGAELAEAIGRVAAGDAVFSPRLAGFVLDAFAGSLPLPSDPELDQLTARERDVLRLIARGYAYKEVARRLNLSVKTVETHVSSVLRKLQLSSRHELTRWATERRLV